MDVGAPSEAMHQPKSHRRGADVKQATQKLGRIEAGADLVARQQNASQTARRWPHACSSTRVPLCGNGNYAPRGRRGLHEQRFWYVLSTPDVARKLRIAVMFDLRLPRGASSQ